jgi:hypothetical protein
MDETASHDSQRITTGALVDFEQSDSNSIHNLVIKRAKELIANGEKHLIPKLLKLHYDTSIPTVNKFTRSSKAFGSVAETDACASDSTIGTSDSREFNEYLCESNNKQG